MSQKPCRICRKRKTASIICEPCFNKVFSLKIKHQSEMREAER